MNTDAEELIGGPVRRNRMEAVLTEHLPKHRNKTTGRVSVQKLARSLSMTRQGVNQWFLREKLPHEQILPLTKLSGSTLTLEMLFPFSVNSK